MRIALAQINSTLGDFSGNRTKILEFTRRALDERCDLVVFPEHALFGYLPGDLLERESIVEEQWRELKRLEREIPKGISVLVGCVSFAVKKKTKLVDTLGFKRFHNSAALIEHGKKTRIFNKERLPSYDIFDETRHLAPGSVAKGGVRLRKHRLWVTICEDIWGWGDPSNPLQHVPRKGTDVVINLSASPFTNRKRELRHKVLKATATHFHAPVIYVNLVGGQDEILFDGRSTVFDSRGRLVGELEGFKEDLAVFDLKSGKLELSAPRAKPTAKSQSKTAAIENLRLALVMGIRDFALKTGIQRAHFGLSGGIDSAVVAGLTVDALGASAVTAVTLPGPFNDPKSRKLAEEMARNLGIRCLNFDIEAPYKVLLKSLESGFGEELPFGLIHENLQARIRGLLLMAFSNKESSLLISTGNKSEYATGYSTLYGDQCGGLAPLGDLLKNEVYALAEHYNREREVIPREIIDRPPSAELRPNQKDQDSLPAYEDLDLAVRRIIEERRPAKNDVEKFVLAASFKSEFKRWQAPPILKVSAHAFGRGRRLPIAHRARQ